MKFNWFYALILVLFLAMLFVSSKFFKGAGNASVGIAYAKEYKINAEKSAMIKTVHVVPGQQVKEGQVLIELTSQDLEMEIDKLTHRISVYKSEQQEKGKLAASEIAYIKAQNSIKEQEIEAQIVQTESEYNLNRKLANAMARRDTTTQHPIDLKLKGLRQQKGKHGEATNIKIQDILQENETEQRLLANQIALLERELILLHEERAKLKKVAAADGVVDNVYVKHGEQVAAYTSLLSVFPTHPTTVIGYWVGKQLNVPVGASVMVSSYDRPSAQAQGKVIGYGAVVPLPDILQKSTAVKAFGREVFIEITAENTFATGEKVLVR